jgi:RimJ/RimL family protein N-acetyltransferase
MATRGRAADEPSGYPCELERAVTLGDGSRVRIRPIRPDDKDRLIELYDRLSRHTAYQRFFTIMKRLPPDWAQILVTVDYDRRLALVAERDGLGGAELIGVGRYEPTERDDTAEVAFVVQDGWQGRGLGTVLLDGVLTAAAARGIRRFVAYVLADNTRMLGLLRRFTDIQSRTVADGVAELGFTRRTTPPSFLPRRRADDGPCA